ncbi:MAG: hydrogen gas-evolving membrane-bound hydrogenase subunit E [Hyphomicrobiaceae bacterium]
MTADAATLDILLAALLVLLVWRLLTLSDLFRASVLFIVFGLLLSLAWVRLGAPDVALAEAGIGAGVTGALVLDALRRLGAQGAVDQTRPLRLNLPRLTGAVLITCVGAILVWSVLNVPTGWRGLSAEAIAAMPNAGVSNPVTASLLNFRAYDTLLEIAVLILAVLGVWALDAEPKPPAQPSGPILELLVRTLLPLMVIVAGYLLWAGGHAPGGAFQGAAVLAGGGILLHLARPFDLTNRAGIRLAIGFGFAVFLAVGVMLVVLGGRFLEFPARYAGTLILVIEAVAMISIALILLVLFVGNVRDRAGRDAP